MHIGKTLLIGRGSTLRGDQQRGLIGAETMNRPVLSTAILRLAGTVLVAAGILKGYSQAQYFDTASLRDPGEIAWLLLAATEIGLGVWFVLGPVSRRLWAGAATAYAFLLAASLFQALSGRQSCGCLGPIEVPAWSMVLLDSLFLGAMLWLWSAPMPRPSRWRQVATVASVLLLFPVAAYLFYAQTPLAVADSTSTNEPAPKSFVIDTQQWIGREFPLLRFCENGHRLARGKWIVMLYRWHCGRCQRVLPVEMSAIFGDDPGPGQGVPLCWKAFTCRDVRFPTSFIHPQTGFYYNCTFCDSGQARDVCCTGEPGQTCTYDGINVCVNAKRYYGVAAGNLDSCSIYPSCSNVVAFGRCLAGSERNAQGDQCN